MKTIDLAHCPTASQPWLSSFMNEFLEREPSVSAVLALEHAELAHRVSWLLDAAEAAELWLSAVRHHGWLSPGAWPGNKP